MSKKTEKINEKEIEEEEIEEEPEKEEIKSNPEEKEIENDEDKKIETSKKKKRKRKKLKKNSKDAIENAEEKEEKIDEENKEETNNKKIKNKKKKKKKTEKDIEETKNDDNLNIDNENDENNNNIEQENNINQDEINKNENINEEKIDEEIKEEKLEEINTDKKIEEEKTEELTNNKKKPNTKKNIKNSKNKSKPEKKQLSKKRKLTEEEEEVEEEENSNNEEKEEEEEDIEEQETRPTERTSSKKNKKKGKQISKFHINQQFIKELNSVYKILLKKDETEEEEQEEEEDEQEASTSKKNSNMFLCEKKLRNALDICYKDEEMIINKSVIEKMNKIASCKKTNINYILGNIYIVLMYKEALFDYENEKNFDFDDLLLFIDNVIKFREETKNYNNNILYDESLKQFLFFVSEQFELEAGLMKTIKKILDEDTDINHTNLITNKTFEKFINSLSKELEGQINLYEQYEIFLQNKKNIIKLIHECDPEEKSNYNDYLKLGKFLAYMLFNSSMNIYLEKNAQIEKEESDEDEGDILVFFNGKENRGEINIINGEKFYIEMDDKIKEQRKGLGDIIINYCQQFIDIIDVFQIQYIIFILLSRLYSCKYKKFSEDINNILSESIINMCFFKTSPMKLISDFINKILESDKPENLSLQKLLLIKIKELKDEEGFLYQMPENLEKKYKDKKIKEEPKKTKKKKSKKKKTDDEEESEEEDDDLFEAENLEKFEEIISDENLFLLHNDLKFGYFNQKVIKSGEKFIFFEELSQDYSLLDFCFTLSDLDIKFTITDITEGKEIYSKERIISKDDTPLKIVMCFTQPRILKFEFDNSYSWVRSKTIKYKTNIFYPKYPYLLNHQILLGKYISNISKTKKDIERKKNKGKKKVFSDDTDKLLILKFNEKYKVFNCVNIQNNLEAINNLNKNNFLSIFSIFLKIKDDKNIEDKSYFYYYSNEKKDLIEIELNSENFDNLISKTLDIDSVSLNIINLYIINGDDNNINYSSYSLKKLFGFEPEFKSNILYFIQNLNQAQLLNCLYKQIISNESIDVVILMNYTKYSGFQINVFDSDELIDFNEGFKGLNKNSNLEENIKILSEGIGKMELGEERKALVVICSSIDEKENEITPEKIKTKLEESLGKENRLKNINIIQTDNNFNTEVKNYSHLFYIENN